MELFLFLIVFIVMGWVAFTQANAKKRPPYGTQAFLEWEYPNDPYMRAAQKKALTCAFGHLPLTQAEKDAYNKHEQEHGRQGIE